MNRKLIAIVPAAGVGQRAGSKQPKQYQSIHGQPMLRHAVQALLAEPRIAQVRVIVASGDTRIAPALAGLARTVARPCGGTTRAETVMAGLHDALEQAALTTADWVLVHDAARPGLPVRHLATLIDTCLRYDRGGLLALPVNDTVKRGATMDTTVPLQQVQATLQRDQLWLAQTPQMFPAGELLRACTQAHQQGQALTDEASAMEAAGHSPLLVTGSPANMKVTWPDDFTMVAHWLQPGGPVSRRIDGFQG